MKAVHKPTERGFTPQLAVLSIVTVPISFFALSFHFNINFNYINDIRITDPNRKLNYYR